MYFWYVGTHKEGKCLPVIGNPCMGVSKPKRMQLKLRGSVGEVTSVTRRMFKHAGIAPFPELDASELTQGKR